MASDSSSVKCYLKAAAQSAASLDWLVYIMAQQKPEAAYCIPLLQLVPKASVSSSASGAQKTPEACGMTISIIL